MLFHSFVSVSDESLLQATARGGVMEEALSGCCSRCANGLKAGTSVRRLPPATGMGTWQLDQQHSTEVVSCLGRMFSLEPVARAFQLSVPFNARREIIAPLQLIAGPEVI